MPFRKSPSMDRAGVERLAEGWGKVVARRVHEEVGPELDLDADDIEQMAVTAATRRGPGHHRRPAGAEGRACWGPSSLARACRTALSRRSRATDDRPSGAARSPTPNPSATARPAAGIFFPQRPALRLTPHNYSPSVLRKVVRSAAREPSFREAAEAVADLAEVNISSRQLDRIAREVGEQLRAERDEQVARFQAGTLQPRVADPAGPGCRRGRRRPAPDPRRGRGARGPRRGLARGQDRDPGDDVPRSPPSATPSRSCPPASATGPSSRRSSGPSAGPGRWVRRPPRSRSRPCCRLPAAKRSPPSRGPRRSWRCALTWPRPPRSIASGRWSPPRPDRRNFAEAAARAFLGDGSAWIWGLHRRYFPTFVAIVDFLHALAHLFTAARAMAA